MNVSQRLFKHLFTTRGSARRAFPPETLKDIENVITEGENQHRAEVRLIVEPSLSLADVLAKRHPRQRAIALFAEYGVWDTEENCGVLVYVNLADRKVEIVPDRDVANRITPEEWNAICRTMTDNFSKGKFRESTVAAIKQLNALLVKHYPDTVSQKNQLPNHPIVL